MPTRRSVLAGISAAALFPRRLLAAPSTTLRLWPGAPPGGGGPSGPVTESPKGAVRNIARSWAQDLRGTGIRVNVLSPGPIKTELAYEIVGEEQFKQFAPLLPLERLGEPSEPAAVAAFLASDDSSFMTGSEVFVDGGLAQI